MAGNVSYKNRLNGQVYLGERDHVKADLFKLGNVPIRSVANEHAFKPFSSYWSGYWLL